MKPRVYLETTIISYLTARPSRDLVTAAYQEVTRDWWENQSSQFELFVSQLVLDECSRGDKQAVAKRLKLLQNIPILEIAFEEEVLANELIVSQALPQKAAGDALHIAVAAVNGIDYLLTWNFKHIVNVMMRQKIEQICRQLGYEPPILCTPQELLEE